MASLAKLYTIFLVAASALILTSARNLEVEPLSARLKVAEEGRSSCWDALMELRACAGEVVMFFLNGETHLGENCCDAIVVIEHQCWPAMLGTLGITAQETDVLRGYCDAAAAAKPPESDVESCFHFPRLIQYLSRG